jgi:hypothetical protein
MARGLLPTRTAGRIEAALQARGVDVDERLSSSFVQPCRQICDASKAGGRRDDLRLDLQGGNHAISELGILMDKIMSLKIMLRTGFALLVVGALCGCNSSAPPPQAAAPQPAPARTAYTPPDFQMPSGSGCANDIGRWKAVQENDYRMGQVNDNVYAEIQGEISAAQAACQSGKDAEARRMVADSKRRHGYPG